jgi:hypothetical protein
MLRACKYLNYPMIELSQFNKHQKKVYTLYLYLRSVHQEQTKIYNFRHIKQHISIQKQHFIGMFDYLYKGFFSFIYFFLVYLVLQSIEIYLHVHVSNYIAGK